MCTSIDSVYDELLVIFNFLKVRIHRGFGLVDWMTTSEVYTKILALPYSKIEIF